MRSTRVLLFLFALPLLNLAQTPAVQGPLTNLGVMQLVQNGVPADEVLRVIGRAPSVSFNLLPTYTDQLMRAGVSEEEIKMMAARQNGGPSVPGHATARTPFVQRNAAGPPVDIPEATKVRVRLEQPLSSQTAEEGQPVQLAVSEDIEIDGAVVIPQGSVVDGTVVKSVPKRRMGRTGVLDFSIDTITAQDGRKIRVRYSIIKKEGGSHAARNGVITAGVAVVFWPAAPFVLLMKGKETIFNKGMTFDVFTDTKFSSRSREAEPASTPQPGAVIITSQPSLADIDVDGVFAGNTPSTLQLTPGQHRITISKASKSWQRTMAVESGNDLTLSVTLEDKPNAASLSRP